MLDGVFWKIITYFRKLNFFIFLKSLFHEKCLMQKCTNFYEFILKVCFRYNLISIYSRLFYIATNILIDYHKYSCRLPLMVKPQKLFLQRLYKKYEGKK